MVMAMILYVNNFYFQLSLIFDQQRLMFYALICGTFLNILLNLLLIPRWGIEGSAIATVGGQLVNGILYILIISKKTFIRPFDSHLTSTLIGAIISGTLMWFFLWLIKLSFYVSIPYGIGLYLILFFMIKNESYSFIVRRSNA